MTTYLDYKVNPPENNGPPPVGAPENMPTNQVNNVQREMMSVIRQLGDTAMAAIDDLGTMANQNADTVAITGGTVTATLAGPGAGITNLKAQNLIEGPIPAAVFPADATPLNVKVARAGQADGVTNAGSLALLPIGTVIMWWGSSGAVPAGWRICDGGGGTPNLLGRVPICAGAGISFGQVGGAYQANVVTDAQGFHSHGGGTAGHVLSVGEMPSHQHAERSGWTSGNYQPGTGRLYDGSVYDYWIIPPNVLTDPTGGNAAHAHGIGGDGSHQHNVSVATVPPYVALWFIMRVS